MIKNKAYAITSIFALLSVASSAYAQTAPDVELGAAGPGNLSILDYGNFSLSFNPATVTINGQQVVEGEVNGNLADYSGNIATSTSGQLNGNVYLGSGASGFTGPNVTSPSSIPASDLAIAFGSGYGTHAAFASGGAAQYYNNLTPNSTVAPAAGNVAAGVYTLSSWNISGGTYNLTAGKVYVFNIAGNFSLNQAAQFLDTTPQDVIFNVGGSVQTSGGLNNPGEVEIEGIIMAQGQISMTPGYGTPEMISDTSINIASGGGVEDSVQNIPDNSPTLVLFALGLAGLGYAGRKFRSSQAL